MASNFPIEITPTMKANLSCRAEAVRDMPTRAEMQEIANELEDLTGKYVEISYHAGAFTTGKRICFWRVWHGDSEQHFSNWPDLVEWVERNRSLLRKSGQ